MLGGALTEENDSVLFVDLLTYSDLELLKARKSGNSNVGYSSVGGKSGTSTQAAISNKRYVILTYSGELMMLRRLHSFVHLSVCLLVFFVVCQIVSLLTYSFCSFICLFICPLVCLSACLSVCLSVYLSVCLSDSLLVC